MSTLVVEVCEVKADYPFPQADALEFITVKGWQVIVQKALGLVVGLKSISADDLARKGGTDEH